MPPIRDVMPAFELFQPASVSDALGEHSLSTSVGSLGSRFEIIDKMSCRAL